MLRKRWKQKGVERIRGMLRLCNACRYVGIRGMEKCCEKCVDKGGKVLAGGHEQAMAGKPGCLWGFSREAVHVQNLTGVGELKKEG